MRIYGIDFTSAPSSTKPITCAVCTLQDNRLRVQDCLKLVNFDDFEAFLRSNGPWLAALDFPFGLPNKLISHLEWSNTWQDYMQIVASMEKKQFEEILRLYGEGREKGNKLHLRITDALAGARSPMMLYRVPVGKMFFEGAPRLLRANVSISPCRPTADDRIVVEGYPALVARKFIGKQSYKSDAREKQTSNRAISRREIVNGLRSSELFKWYSLKIEMADELSNRLVEDPMGDELDAVLCSVQAGWAWLHKFSELKLPEVSRRIEGWIVDPLTTKSYDAHKKSND